MSIWWVIGIIVLVLGLIISNLLLLKQTANMKLPKINDAEQKYDRYDEDDENDKI